MHMKHRTSPIACAVLTWAATVLTAAATTVDYYRFGGNLNDSGNLGQNGSVLSGSVAYSTSVPTAVVPQTGAANGNSLSLSSGADSMIVNAPFQFHSAGDATMEFWLNPTNLAGNYEGLFWTRSDLTDSNRFNIFLKNNGAGGYSINFDYREPNGTLHGLLNSEQPGAGGVTIPFNIPINAWTFVAFVRSGNTYSAYLNGSQTPAAIAIDGTGGNPAPNLPTSSGWEFNSWNGNTVLLDELRISDSALTPSQFLVSAPEPSTGLLLLAASAILPTLRRRARA